MPPKKWLPIALFLSLITLIPLISLIISLNFVLTHATFDNKTKSDAIIVLGSRTRDPKGNPNPCLLSRVEHGVTLYKKGYGSKIIVAGGYNPDDHYTEADEMKGFAIALGAKPEDVLEETKSTSTFENLENSKTILKQHNLETVIIVTEAYHSPRADLIAQKLNIEHTVSPTTDTPCWNEGINHINFFLLRDSAALIVYKIEGKI